MTIDEVDECARLDRPVMYRGKPYRVLQINECGVNSKDPIITIDVDGTGTDVKVSELDDL